MGGWVVSDQIWKIIFLPFPNSEQPYIASAEFKVWMRQLHRKSSPDSQKYFVQNCVSEGYSLSVPSSKFLT